ncbi:UDP-N-acetylglucosamine transferase subunit ALG14 homolog isoform X2 [Micropterus salmoides]|uniref:UDP-N-acetylglucosamine transferase subunit ALG14 homolog isoform X2 n=1 Tax=Micropterus salmoides TaxID=27706 RepID=UPI0018EBC16C|nr:UDP-N-acetylglucosamine transferase subunit ALG14 homolog isoform X2 [Micropterus salmoides]
MVFVVEIICAILLVCLLFVIRLYVVVKTGPNCRHGTKGPVAVLVVAGSGGHTTEILRLMECLSAVYTPRHYVIADTDMMSEEKISTFESSKRHSDSEPQVLCNGPGTCVPLCVGGLLLGILGMKKVLIVYVESICRVQTLSLTGKILYPISDYFFVQWSCLRDKYPKSIFFGRIV